MDTIRILDAYVFVNRWLANHTLDVYQLMYFAMWNWLKKQDLLTKWTVKAVT